MECNRDEALKAVEVAERKFEVQDYATARKFLLKAQQLYPALEKVSPMLAVVEVLTVAQARAPGTEIDWYQLLQVDTNADDSTIKKNYRRFALLLHPDKNKSPGAETAFKLIGEAWALLSDATKRRFYDTKRMLHTKPTNIINLSMPPKNWYPNQQQSQAKTGTFWTACPNCRMQYEYYRTYLNFNLKCQKCLKVFVAYDLHASPANGVSMPYGWPSNGAAVGTGQSQGFEFLHQRFHNVFGGVKIPGFGAATTSPGKKVTNEAKKADANGGGAATTSPGKKVANEAKKADANGGGIKAAENAGKDVKKEPAAEQYTRKGIEREANKPKVQKDVMAEAKKKEAIDTLIMKRKKKEEAAVCRKSVEPHRRKRLKKVAPGYEDDSYEHEDELEDELEKPTTVVPERFDAEMASQVRRSSRRRKNVYYNFDHSEDEEDEDLVASPCPRRRSKVEASTAANLQKDNTSPSTVQSSHSDSKPESDDTSESDDGSDADEFLVSDPDFHNFDDDRTPKSFGAGQIWAVYDEFDGMPRYYCRIINVLSGNGFAVSIKWLEPLPAYSTAIQGVSSPCGEFVHGEQKILKNNNQFSHIMRVEMAGKSLCKIYPRSGQVWALFRGLNIMPSVTDQVQSCNQGIVEIVSDFSKEKGVTYFSLVRVDGYNTVFTRQLKDGLPKINWLPASELSKFSHMVPSWNIIEKEEGATLPKGSWDLDPASLPLELIGESTHHNSGR